MRDLQCAVLQGIAGPLQGTACHCKIAGSDMQGIAGSFCRALQEGSVDQGEGGGCGGFTGSCKNELARPLAP
eukprot:8968524-Pyramimonas_sp.AAC.1